MSRIDKIYSSLPVYGQHMAVSSYGLYWYFLRFGRGYNKYLKEYRYREKWLKCQWDIWQQNKLIELLQMSTENVPYYKYEWDKKAREAARLGLLKELPLLGKEPIRSTPEYFLRTDRKFLKKYCFHTSGSTGTPIKAYFTANEIRKTTAIREARSANWAGVSYKIPRATFSGRLVEPDPNSLGPFYRFNLIENQVYFSPFHLKPDTAKYYISALKKHKIKWITGYAVSLYLLAKFIVEKKLSIPVLNAVITTSEKLTDNMRKIMEIAYNCKIYEEYSTVENVLFASECKKGNLHVSPDIGIVEILRPDNTHCEPGEIGEVVTTCLFREYQPFIRYRIGDLAAWDDQPCSCGIHMPIIKDVVGRIEDVVIGPDGRRLVRFHGIFVDQPHIREGQIIQEKINLIKVKIITTDGFNDHDIEEVKNRILKRLGKHVKVMIEIVEQIPRTKSGKFQAVISRLRQKSNRDIEHFE
jgi:phenylacetate-CoA ligase